MKNNIPVAVIALAVAAMSFTACDKNRAKVSGRLAGSDSRTIVLEQITAKGAVKTDSTRTSRNGTFRLNVKLPATGTTFYNLRIENSRIPLFISPGEKIKITSHYGQPGKYSLDGSHESMLVKELNDILTSGSNRLDSLAGLLSVCTAGCPQRPEYIQAYIKEYGNLKREQIKFIIANSGSLASLYALYQRLPNDQTLFNGNNDIIYYRLVADSVAKYYPESPYLAALRAEIDSVDSSAELNRMISENIEHQVSYPDISLPDMYGKERKLSDLDGKVILLDFWSASDKDAAINNAELKVLYNEFANLGLEIYQVSIDTSKPLWINALQSQALPWISVCDLKGMDGAAPGTYNINSVPANYLINRSGEIAGKNVPIEKLRGHIAQLTALQ